MIRILKNYARVSSLKRFIKKDLKVLNFLVASEKRDYCVKEKW